MSVLSIGARYGRLTVVERIQDERQRYYRCLCECGQEKDIRGDHLASGRTTSCGCRRKERSSEPRKHGLTGTRVYRIWRNMLNRCGYDSHPDWKRYGGRGITVCDKWRSSFESFYRDMGFPPDGMSIDRINNDGNYEPGNCKWSTVLEQAANRRRPVFSHGKRVSYDGKSYTIEQLAIHLGTTYSTIARRLRRNAPLDVALPKGKAKASA